MAVFQQNIIYKNRPDFPQRPYFAVPWSVALLTLKVWSELTRCGNSFTMDTYYQITLNILQFYLSIIPD